MNVLFLQQPALFTRQNNNVQQQNSRFNTGKPYSRLSKRKSINTTLCSRLANNIARTLFPSTVRHIPIELGRYSWFVLQRGADIRGEIKSIRYKPSPLIQGGLEIPIEVTVKWDRRQKGDGHFAQESRSGLSPWRKRSLH